MKKAEAGAEGKKQNEETKTKPKAKSGNYTYNADRVIGNGSFGVVYQAHVAETGEVVAIKKVYQDKRYRNRELQIMKEIFHPNIVTLKHAFYTKGEKQDEIYLNLVMDCIPETAYRIMKHYNKMKQPIPTLLVKLYIYQLARSLAHLHQIGVCHRDIKPQNLLVDPTNHLLKLCDFGSAKRLIRGEPNVAYICSRYYRAPELIFGATEYTEMIDVWSMGCVLAEFLLGHPLFPGESGVDQLVEIIKVLGTPTKEQIMEMNPNYTEFKFPQIKAHAWHKVFRSRTPPDGVDLVSKMLVYEPQNRQTPIQLLAHPFFDELRDRRTRLPNGTDLPELFNFTEEEKTLCDAELLEKLVPEWYHNKLEGKI